MVERELRLQRILYRIAARRLPVMLAGGLTVSYVAFGRLSPTVALAGIVAVLVAAGLWPSDEKPLLAPEHPLDKPQVHVDAEPSQDRVWKAMLEGLLDPALVLDQRGDVLAANSAAAALFPVVMNGHLSQASRAPELLSAVERAFLRGTPQTFQVRTVTPVERRLTGLVTPLGPDVARDSGLSLLVVIRDQTSDDRLARMRSDFVANASHELRTPLASIKGFVETLQGAAKDDPVARNRFLDIMQEQAARMSRLIEDLLSLSRIEMRQHVAPSETVDLATVVDDVAATLAPIAAKAGSSITTTIETRPVVVTGDRDELAQVVQNLVHNAIKYGRTNGQVVIRLRQDGARVTLAVIDDGIGIAPEHVPRLTERFYRVNAKESRERGGTGLGLAIVKHIVNRHRGDLKIESRAGAGSTFTVILTARSAIK